ncbi:MAG: phosphoenolpyruvate carboxylase, partial [Flavobacterium sp.]
EKHLDSNSSESQKIDLMFRFIQYIERQVVLFDAIEDAAFAVINDLEGKGSLRDVKDSTESDEMKLRLKEFLRQFSVRTVLTAHPTQFYPGAVLGIITDLTQAIREDDLHNIKQLLSQLGKTPFIKKEKPTPYDEAVSLVWYLENVFYQTAGEMVRYIRSNLMNGENGTQPLIAMGFWPGGDRDGNPFVDTKTTLMVAARLQNVLLKCYHRDMRRLRRKLTFAKVEALVSDLEQKIYQSAYYANGDISITLSDFLNALNGIREIVIAEHQSLYLEDIDELIGKVHLFGLHFATLDIRQNSKIHKTVIAEIADAGYNDLDEDEQINWLMTSSKRIDLATLPEGMTKSTLESAVAMKTIQEKNGERGANRYIISNNESALDVIEALSLFRFTGWENPSVDIVPLFEIIEDLRNAEAVMEKLYTNPYYAEHLKR